MGKYFTDAVSIRVIPLVLLVVRSVVHQVEALVDSASCCRGQSLFSLFTCLGVKNSISSLVSVK